MDIKDYFEIDAKAVWKRTAFVIMDFDVLMKEVFDLSPEVILKKYFGLPALKKEQAAVIKEILSGRDVLAVLPTGYGKSICYQIPSLIMQGPTIVVSPLISLMKDQVDALTDRGIPATYINSSLTLEESNERKRNIRKGKYRLIYVSPESLKLKRFAALLRDVRPAQVAVDEAHCISVWGHDFRPSYLDVHEFVDTLSPRPVLTSFTATATDLVRNDIHQLLRLQNPFILMGDLNRKNLYFEVRTVTNDREDLMREISKRDHEQGIIYCQRRKEAEAVEAFLRNQGYRTGLYHGGMDDQIRKKVQEAFSYDQIQIVVATNAFGMGIDKSNVRFVIHLGIPKNIESYYQEAGRAGRDQSYSECILLYRPKDRYRQNQLILASQLSKERKVIEQNKLLAMDGYGNTSRCLRSYLLDYFEGATETLADTYCGNCATCVKAGRIDPIIFYQEAVIACLTLGEDAEKNTVKSFMLASASMENSGSDMTQLKNFGSLRHFPEDAFEGNWEKFIDEGYIEGNAVTSKGMLLFPDKQELPSTVAARDRSQYQEELFVRLKNLRRDLSRNIGIAPYIIFHDENLKDIVRKMPFTIQEFMEVRGVGRVKSMKYGAYFLTEIHKFAEEYQIDHMEFKDTKTTDHEQLFAAFDTYHLYEEGKSIEEIAKILSVVSGTVVDRLLKEHRLGKNVDLDRLFKFEFEADILNSIRELKTDKLRPIRDDLLKKGIEVEYTDLKVVFYKHFGVYKK